MGEMENEGLKKAYSEVIAVLRLVEDEEKLEKLPMEFLELIRSKADSTYMPILSKEIPIEEQGLRDETYSILAWIASKYWNEEVYLDKTYEAQDQNNKSNEEVIEQSNKNNDIKEVFVYTDIEEECLEAKEVNSNLPILYKDLNWFEKIKIRVRLIFNKLFRKNRIINEEVLE